MKRLIWKRPVISYFAIAYLLSWLCWLPLAFGHWNTMADSPAALVCVFLGSLGPAAASVVCTGLTGGKGAVQDHLKKLVAWRFHPVWWLLAVFGFVPIFFAMGLLFGKGSLSDLPMGFVNTAINLAPSLFIIGPLGEELGWRGYALPLLSSRLGLLRAGLAIGALWALWHAPLAVFLPGWRGGVPLGQFALSYLALLLPLSVLFTWLTQRCKGSVLAAMLLHASYNYNAAMFMKNMATVQTDTAVVNWAATGAVTLLAAAVVAANWKQMTREMISDS